jgi:hypothetical protein
MKKQPEQALILREVETIFRLENENADKKTFFKTCFMLYSFFVFE